jgi:hypothetical protein
MVPASRPLFTTHLSICAKYRRGLLKFLVRSGRELSVCPWERGRAHAFFLVSEGKRGAEEPPLGLLGFLRSWGQPSLVEQKAFNLVLLLLKRVTLKGSTLSWGGTCWNHLVKESGPFDLPRGFCYILLGRALLDRLDALPGAPTVRHDFEGAQGRLLLGVSQYR